MALELLVGGAVNFVAGLGIGVFSDQKIGWQLDFNAVDRDASKSLEQYNLSLSLEKKDELESKLKKFDSQIKLMASVYSGIITSPIVSTGNESFGEYSILVGLFGACNYAGQIIGGGISRYFRNKRPLSDESKVILDQLVESWKDAISEGDVEAIENSGNSLKSKLFNTKSSLAVREIYRLLDLGVANALEYAKDYELIKSQIETGEESHGIAISAFRGDSYIDKAYALVPHKSKIYIVDQQIVGDGSHSFPTSKSSVTAKYFDIASTQETVEWDGSIKGIINHADTYKKEDLLLLAVGPEDATLDMKIDAASMVLVDLYMRKISFEKHVQKQLMN